METRDSPGDSFGMARFAYGSEFDGGVSKSPSISLLLEPKVDPPRVTLGSAEGEPWPTTTTSPSTSRLASTSNGGRTVLGLRLEGWFQHSQEGFLPLGRKTLRASLSAFDLAVDVITHTVYARASSYGEATTHLALTTEAAVRLKFKSKFFEFFE